MTKPVATSRHRAALSGLHSLVLVSTLLGANPVRAAEYTWPAYSPAVAYDFRDEYPGIEPPTKVLPGVTGVEGTYTSEWWCFVRGTNTHPSVTAAAWEPMLQRYEDDFNYITDVMGYPRDKRAKNGYYSTIYLLGSGLSTDNLTWDDAGGWMGSTDYGGEGWPCVIATRFPVAAFDPAQYSEYQTGGMIHEGVHEILADMPGGFNAAWAHEGCDNWVLGTMAAQRTGDFTGMGFLSAGSMIAPFMPIECYSGWLQDGSFGGPSAEGVNLFNGTQQICTWRNLLGGVQYSECFPHAMEIMLGAKSVAWLWRNAHYSGRMLQDLAEAPDGIGAAQTRRLIQEYRGRQAFCDFGQWSYAFRQLLNDNWGASVEEEWSPYNIDVAPWTATCYVATSNSGGVLTPDTLTLPGWSGANQIPLTVNSSATSATVTFNPIGSNMSCQLVYRDTSGTVHYSDPVGSGACTIPFAAGSVMNNVIVAVVCNTDYIYVNDATRQAKFDYRLTMGSGVTGQANINTKWYDYNPASHTITASTGAHGTISPSGATTVAAWASQGFTFTPDSGYEVEEITLNGLPVGKLSSYTFSPVVGNHTISVSYRLIAPPAAPANLSATAGSGLAKLDWDANTEDDFASYTVYRSSSSGSGYVAIASGLKHSDFTDNLVAFNTPYFYKVTATDDSGLESGFSSEVSATPTYTTTATPALTNPGFEAGVVNFPDGFDADPDVPGWEDVAGTPGDSGVGDANPWFTARGTYSAFLMGGDSGMKQLTGYAIQTGDVFTVGFWAAQWNDNTQLTATLYYDFGGTSVDLGSYTTPVLNWFNGAGLTYYETTIPATAASISHPVGVRFAVTSGTGLHAIIDDISLSVVSGGEVPPAAPTGLSASFGDGSVSLDWDDNGEGDLAGYTVYRSLTSGSGYTAVASNLVSSNYTDTDVVNGTVYYYIVKAFDGWLSLSDSSAEVSTAPTDQPYTVAYWNFEEGTADTSVAYSPGSAGQYDGSMLDVSGHGNHPSAWSGGWATYRSNVAASVTPQNEVPNALCVQNNNVWPAMSAIGTPLTAWSPTAWTIEAAVRPDNATGWQTIVGRDSQGAYAGDTNLAALYFGITDTGAARIMFTDAAGNNWAAISSAALFQAAKWQALVATSDGSTLKLYYKNITDGDATYTLVASTDISTSANPAISAGAGDGADWDPGVWTVTRGLWAGGHTDRVSGYVDDIRLSNGARAPED
ncbi:MAG: hypothetical protein KDN05_03880, partial [Verrucomicrobiae bacterium]|nr:hypothetical protein [Verrucomicrobiae bacterium]